MTKVIKIYIGCAGDLVFEKNVHKAELKSYHKVMATCIHQDYKKTLGLCQNPLNSTSIDGNDFQLTTLSWEMFSE